MAKPIRFMATMFFSIVLAVAGLLQPPTGSSQQSPQANTTSARNAALIAATSEVLKETSELRQLAILRPVQSSTQSRLEIEHMLIKNLDEETTPAQMHAAEATLERLGLAPPDFHYRALMLRVLTEQVAGYYDPKSGEFHLADWIDLDGQRPVMAHELTHALQDQHFNLRRFERWPKGDSDAELAAHALVEGEATLVMIQYDFEQQGMKLDLSKIASLTDGMLEQDNDNDAKNYPVLAGAPKVLKENLQFPYLYGAGFVGAVLKSRSWNGLDTSYVTLPSSTEQIMHPERFLDRDDPVKIEMPDLAGALGADWKKADGDVNGEFGYLVALAEFIPKRTAKTAAAGWGGDRYALYENKVSGALMLAQFTTWDTEGDAKEFFDAYTERTSRRYKLAKPMESNQQRRVCETGEGLASIELRGKDVV